MKVNPGFFINKFIKLIHRPALRDCEIDKTARVGTACNCIRVKMGRYSYMGCYNSVCDTAVGSFCSIASHCSIGGGKHPMNAVSTSPVFYAGRNCLGQNFSDIPEEKNAGVEIGNDVWIGEGVLISDGVKIGTGAVIGAHSVVTGDVEPYAVVAGAPARVLRKRFDEETIARLLASRWWEWPEKKIEANADKFASVDWIVTGDIREKQATHEDSAY